MKRFLSWCLVGLMAAGALTALALPVRTFAAGPFRPFPQHVAYAPGSIKPTNFTQAQMDQHVRAFYDDWKSKYLVAAGTNPAGKQMYRVAFGIGSPATVSEGQGYGMVILPLMAGHDPNAQTLFDGLWYFARRYPSGGDSRLMSWKIENGQIVDGNSSAFDGDADIAYGLLLAHAQWGSGGDVNYAAEANTVIAGILAATIGPNSRLPTLGDWVNPNGSPHSQYTPRSSDFMPSHFRAYGRATGNTVWNTVTANSQTVITSIQTNHSAATGLLPDFMTCTTSLNCSPSPASFLEGPHDGHYYYNAGRDPWRLGMDALLNDNATSRTQVQKLINWVAGNSGGSPNNIRAGYQLNGTAIDTYFTTFFVAPMGVGAMTDSTKQQFLNNIYASVYNTHEDYFEDTVNLLCLLVMTGNFWDPTVGSPVTPTPGTPTSTNTPTPTTPPGSGTGLRGTYYNNSNFTGTTATRTDPTVNFTWSGAPITGIGGDTFSVRWEGQVQPPVSGSYTFSTVSDDGVRLWVNGQQLINNWTDHSSTTNTAAPVTLTGGQKYDIRLEFYDNTGGATIQLRWAYPGQATQIIPQSRLYPPTATPTNTPTNTPTRTPTRTPTNTPVPGGNLALNRPATSSSNEDSILTPDKAVDGNSGTRWGSLEGSDPQWIYVDLGATYNITRVKLNWEAAYATAYRIEVSNDASAWTTIYSTSSGNGGIDDLTGLSGSGRYVRMHGTARATPYGYSLWEFEVY